MLEDVGVEVHEQLERVVREVVDLPECRRAPSALRARMDAEFKQTNLFQ